MALAILWSEFGNGERMTLGLLAALTMLKLISGFPGFYSLSSCHRALFNPPSSNKHWKDYWFFLGGRWLAGDEPLCRRVPSHFRENGEHFTIPFGFWLPLSFP